jgi:diacylglycerol kinase family enzyme
LWYLWKVWRGQHLADASVFHRRVKKVMVSSAGHVPVQIDGDPGGYLAQQTAAEPDAGWVVEVVPSALDVIAMAGPHSRPDRVSLASDGATG